MSATGTREMASWAEDKSGILEGPFSTLAKQLCADPIPPPPGLSPLTDPVRGSECPSRLQMKVL